MKNFELFFLLSFFIEGVFGESLSVKEGDSVTLHTGLTDIRSGKDDVLDWRFEGDLIARVRKDHAPETEDDVLGGRFSGRLKPDRQTGDLTITNITTKHAGSYEISINDTNKMFSVIVVPADPVKTVSVMVGDSVTLNTGVPEPQRYDVIQWRFKNSPIAGINRKTRNAFTSNTTDEGFRDRLQLDYWTGSLTIRNTETKHSGDYEVDISTSNHTIHRSFTVTVSSELKSALSVVNGDSVTIETGLPEIQRDDLMLWMFGHSQIAEIYKADGRFSTSDDRLKLDPQTGSLTITDTRNTDSGLYELKISNSRRTVHKRITVTVTDPALSPGAIAGIVVGVGVLLVLAVGLIYYSHTRIYKRTMLSVMEGEPVTLNHDGTKVHKDDKLLWMFGSSCIAEREIAFERKSAAEWESAAERKRAAYSFTVHDDLLDGRFKDRLDLNHQTGSLIITNTTTTHSGVYELLIIRPGKSSIMRFRVSVFAQTGEIKQVSGNKGGSVTLETGVADMQKVDEILWKFGLNTTLAEIKGETKGISQFADKILKGRLELDHQTGSLIIKKIRPTDAGIYMLSKTEEGNIKTILFRVEVLDPTDNRNKPVEKTVRRNNPEENEPLRGVHIP